MNVETIDPQTLAKLIEADGAVELIDVRTPVEYRAIHATPARLEPLDTLDPRKFAETNGRKLYVICKTGARSRKAAERLAKAGCRDVVCVEGGTDAWVAAGLPVMHDQSVMSLERQVRIVAGALVVVGTLLAAIVSAWWLILPGVVGAGLVFAGVTNTCGMGMLLAKLPWNRRA